MNIKHSLKTLKQCFIITKKPPYSYNPELLELIGTIITKHSNESDIQRIFLCGSRARGKNTAQSDYDIGIVANKPLTRQMLLAIESELNKMLIVPYHLIDINKKPDNFKKTIYSKPVVDILSNT